MDDYRVVTGSEEETRREAGIVGYFWKYLGLQDAPRNRRMTRKYGGLWRSKKVQIVYGSIYQLIGEGKWAKTWLIIIKSEELLDYKELQSD